MKPRFFSNAIFTVLKAILLIGLLLTMLLTACSKPTAVKEYDEPKDVTDKTNAITASSKPTAVKYDEPKDLPDETNAILLLSESFDTCPANISTSFCWHIPLISSLVLVAIFPVITGCGLTS